MIWLHIRCTCWDVKSLGVAGFMGTKSLCFWSSAAAEEEHILSNNREVWMDMWWRLFTSVQLVMDTFYCTCNRSRLCHAKSDPMSAWSNTHTLTLRAVLLFGFPPQLGSSVWKPDLWETDNHSNSGKTVDVVLEEQFDDIKNEVRSWACTLMVSSGSLISADSFSLVNMSAYWLRENSEAGGKNVCVQLVFWMTKWGSLRNAWTGKVTLFKCSALLWGEGGAVSILDTFGSLVIAAHRLKHLCATHFFVDERIKLCKSHMHTISSKLSSQLPDHMCSLSMTHRGARCWFAHWSSWTSAPGSFLKFDLWMTPCRSHDATNIIK